MSETPKSISFVADFLAQIETIAWFSNIGKPTEMGSNVERIYSWDEWPGPMDPSVLALATGQQDLYDAIIGEAGTENVLLLSFWKQIHAVIFRVAGAEVPYDLEQDCFHPPSQCVWDAAWTAGLIGLYRYANRQVPKELTEQWKWYLKGHWPSGYSSIDEDGHLGPLLVF